MNIDFRQTVFVSILVKNVAGNILMIRRANNEDYMPGYYEMPGGRVTAGESLEVAIRRKIKTDLGTEIISPIEYLTSLAHTDSKGPYVRVVFTCQLSGTEVKLSSAYDDSLWVTPSEALHLKLINDSKTVINSFCVAVDQNVANKTSFIINSDGGSRGNPGPSAAAYVLRDGNGRELEVGGEYIGISTNNQAEYTAVLLALRTLMNYADANDSVECKIDSLLVVNQLNGLYKIKNRDLWPIHQEILELAKRFGMVTYRHVPREENTEADAKVNEILDLHDQNS